MYITIDNEKRIRGYNVVNVKPATDTVIFTDLIKRIPDDTFDEHGIPAYLWDEAIGLVKRTQEEMDADYVPPVHRPSDAERILALEQKNATLEEELSATKVLLGLEV